MKHVVLVNSGQGKYVSSYPKNDSGVRKEIYKLSRSGVEKKDMEIIPVQNQFPYAVILSGVLGFAAGLCFWKVWHKVKKKNARNK